MVDFIIKLLLVTVKDFSRLFKMVYFIATTEETIAKKLVRLFKNNVWKLYKLLESVILDKES